MGRRQIQASEFFTVVKPLISQIYYSRNAPACARCEGVASVTGGDWLSSITAAMFIAATCPMPSHVEHMPRGSLNEQRPGGPAMWRGEARIENTEHLRRVGDGCHSRARIAAQALLVDDDRGGNVFQRVRIGLAVARHELLHEGRVSRAGTCTLASRARARMDVARSGTSKRHVAHGAGRPIRSAHGRVAPRIPGALASSARCAPLADDEPESPASRLRRWLRVGSSVQPRLQACVRRATGAIPTGAEGGWLIYSFLWGLTGGARGISDDTASQRDAE